MKTTLTPQTCHGRRVRLVKVLEGEGHPIEEAEQRERVGQEGVCHSPDFDGQYEESVSVLFDDGQRLRCLPEELTLCENATPKPFKQPSSKIRNIQACIAHVGFPDSPLGFTEILDDVGETDMERLLWPPEGETGGGWTAPRWLTEGDIIFFYQTKKARNRINRLLRRAANDEDGEWIRVVDRDLVLERLIDQQQIALRHAGTIFGCALVTGSAAHWDESIIQRNPNRHWKGRIFAPISGEYIFGCPIPDKAFTQSITLSPGGAYTPLYGSDFVALKALCKKTGPLPDYLANARPGGVSFRDLDSTNWTAISCEPFARFIDESQLRAYLIDYLLEEIKDVKSTVYQECRCWHGGEFPTVADYCVRIHGRWIAVEAKLNVRAERDLHGQVLTYMNVKDFWPSRGNGTGGCIAGPTAAISLVIDASGIYLMNRKGFVNCTPGTPIWHRCQLSKSTWPEIRSAVQAMVT